MEQPISPPKIDWKELGKIGIMLIAGFALLGFCTRPGPCTTKSWGKLSDNSVCIFEGMASAVDERTKRGLSIAPMSFGESKPLEMFELTDDAGSTILYLEKGLAMPTYGSTVKARTKLQRDGASGAGRYLIVMSFD